MNNRKKAFHPDRHRSLLACRDMCHASLMKPVKGDSVMKRLYLELCLFPSELPERHPPLSVELKYSHQPEPKFAIDLQPIGNGRFLGVATANRQIIVTDQVAGVDWNRRFPFEGVASLTSREGGFAVLSEREQAIIEVDADLNRVDTIPMNPLGVEIDFATRISRNADKYVLTAMKDKKVHFVGRDDFRTIDVSHMLKIFKGEGFGKGSFLFDYSSGEFCCGELVWISESGEIISILGGLKGPVQARPCDGGLLVCDSKGLHVLTMEGLMVTEQRVLLWGPLLEELGFRAGYGNEAFLLGNELVVKFDTSTLSIFNSQRFCLASYVME